MSPCAFTERDVLEHFKAPPIVQYMRLTRTVVEECVPALGVRFTVATAGGSLDDFMPSRDDYSSPIRP